MFECRAYIDIGPNHTSGLIRRTLIKILLYLLSRIAVNDQDLEIQRLDYCMLSNTLTVEFGSSKKDALRVMTDRWTGSNFKKPSLESEW